MDLPTVLFIAGWTAKAAFYGALFTVAQRRWVLPEDRRVWRPIVGALARGVCGVVLGVPLAFVLTDKYAGNGPVFAWFSLLRFALWSLTLLAVFRRRARARDLVALALIGVAANWLIDVAVGEGDWWLATMRTQRWGC